MAATEPEKSEVAADLAVNMGAWAGEWLNRLAAWSRSSIARLLPHFRFRLSRSLESLRSFVIQRGPSDHREVGRMNPSIASLDSSR